MYCVWQVVKTPAIILNNPVLLRRSLETTCTFPSTFQFPKRLLRPKLIPPITLVWKFPNPLTCQEHFHKRTHTIMISPVYSDGSHRYRMEIHECNIASIAWNRPPWNLDKILPKVQKTTVQVNRRNAYYNEVSSVIWSSFLMSCGDGRICTARWSTHNAFDAAGGKSKKELKKAENLLFLTHDFSDDCKQ